MSDQPVFARIALLLALLAPALAAGAGDAPRPDADSFAVVGGTVIGLDMYQQALRDGVRERYYHGHVPEAESESYREAVADDLIKQTLLVQEADRRGIRPDAEWVEARLAQIEARNARQAGWATHRAAVLEAARASLEIRRRIALLEAEVRAVGDPHEKQLRAFHADNLDKFTEPERVRVSLILLGVDPAAAPDVRRAARERGLQIAEAIGAGADFAELAREVSTDPSAAHGGDMGYLHRGMIGEHAQKVVDELEPGEVSEAVVLLEGVALFRLEERVPPRVNDIEEVRPRAARLWREWAGEQAWQDFVARLREDTEVVINQAAVGQAGAGARAR